MAQTPTPLHGRDVLLVGLIVAGFLGFQVGADITTGAGAVLALLGLLVALGAVATFIYDHLVRRRLDADAAPTVAQPAISRFLFHDLRPAPLWFVVRLWLGFAWVESGWGKITGSPSWLTSGASLRAYWERAVAIPKAPAKPAITYDWYRTFLQFMLDNHWDGWFAKVVCLGELLVGVGLIVGGLTGIAAFFGALLNMSFLLAGSASTNPVLFTLAILVILAWQVAGYYGADRFLLPLLGAPWRPGRLVRHDGGMRANEPRTAGS